jgi:glycosyltransferase involved in cell wall biosynthesis
MKEKEYDLCHAFFGIPCGAIAYQFRNKIPYIVSLRGSDVPGFNKRFSLQYVFLTPTIKKIWRTARAVVANSEGLKELALNSSPDQEIDIIYNGIDISEFEPCFEIHDVLKVLCVSRLIERKGIRFLIEAIGMLKDDKIELVLVGEGNQEEELKQLAKDLGVADGVEFRGYVDHDSISDIYKNSDVFVLPSLNEGMSNALLEAMASGLPVIVTDTGGTSELIDRNGIVVPKGDSNAIAQAVCELMDDPEVRRRMGMKSREIAARTGWGVVGDGYIKVYEKVLSEE